MTTEARVDRSPMRHVLKTHVEFFAAVLDGRKTFEVRKDDRNFAVGDMLALIEHDPVARTNSGRMIEAFVTYKLDGGQFGIEPGYCVLGFNKILVIRA